jgi:LssY C-terminus
MLRRAALAALALALLALAIYLATHVVAPRFLTHFDRAPELASLPKRTIDGDGRAADPINLAIVGSRAELLTAMRLAGWHVADSLTRKSKIAIARSVLLDRPDSTAPVSPLYLLGREEDIAFEREVGNSARTRHHARFWLAADASHDGRQLWIGDASFDARAGLSHRTLRPTHHIAPNIDEERDTLVADLSRAGQIAERFEVTGMGPRIYAHNAEGDRFDTDGEMAVAVISLRNVRAAAPRNFAPPTAIAVKNRVWRWMTRAFDAHSTPPHSP